MAIYIEPAKKLVHACKYKPDLGIGMTRCGYTFLMGDKFFKPEPEFGAPGKEGSPGTYSRCTNCEKCEWKAHHARWKRLKKLMRDTLVLLGVNVAPADTTIEPADAVLEASAVSQ